MINDLQPSAVRYLKLVREGYGTELSNRNFEQIAIANAIVTEALPYVEYIAKSLINPALRHTIKLRVAGGKIIRPTLRHQNMDLGDLVQNGCLAIIDSLKYYNPNYKLDGYLTYRVVNAMFNSKTQETFVKVGRDNYRKWRKIVQKEGLQGIIDSGVTNFYKATLIYLAVTGDWDQLEPKNNTLPDRYWERLKWPSGINEEECLAVDEGLLFDEEVDVPKIEMEVALAIETLKPRYKEIIRKRFWDERSLEEIGKDYDLSRERISSIEKEALNKLKHPTRLGRIFDY